MENLIIGFLIILIVGLVLNNPKTPITKQSSFSNPIPTEIIVPTPTPEPTKTPTNPPRKLDGGRLFNLVNDYRKKNGLSELLWYHHLCNYAKTRSQEIKTDWSHEGYLKDSAEGTIYSSICPECTRTGENLAKDFYSEKAVLQAWIKSPTHKENLDGNWDWGCAMYYSNNYVSILFGKSK